MLPQNMHSKIFLKKFLPQNYSFKIELAKPENQKFLKFLFIFLFVERELFKHKQKKKKISYTFPHTETNFSKLKFLIIIIRHFFSIYNIFSILNQFLFLIFWEIFVTFTAILLLFFFSSLGRFWYFSRAFFVVFPCFLDNI